jgi:outer membrane protein assembly factor BamB
LKQKALWCSTPAGRNGGIWQSGQGPAADAEGNIYVTIGDGTFAARDSDYGDSFVKLRLEDGQLTVKDYFTPCNQAYLAKNDLDFGSSGPISIPGTSFLLGAGKQGRLYLLDSHEMGKYVASPGPRDSNCVNPNARDEVQVTAGGHLHGSPVFWQGPDAPRVYVWGEMDALKSYVVRQGKLQTPPAKSNYVIGCDPPQEMCMPGGMLSISSDQNKPGSGIVWAVVPSNGDASKRRGVAGMVLALDAENVSRELWRSERPDGKDQLGMFAKFCPPTVAGGKVFVATYGDRAGDPAQNYADVRYYLAVYGILP